MKYWSPATRGFYDDAVHGPRTIEVVDEEALAAARATADTLDQAEFDQALEDFGEEAQLDRANFTLNRHLVDVAPPMKTVDNPACLLPADAVPIDDARHAALLAAQSGGKAIASDELGLPIAVERTRSAEEVLAAVRAERNRKLAASDWTQLADASLTAAKRKAWAAFRTHLKELPAKVEEALAEGRDPAEIAWPEPPG